MSAARSLTTTQAASILQCSRQHVVSLCDDGTLPSHRVGTHRRIRDADLQRFAQPRLTLAEEQALWVHYAIATKLVAEPQAMLAAAAARLEAMRDMPSDGHKLKLYDRWQRLLDEGPGAVLDAITSRAPASAGLRSASPLTSLLTQEEQAQLLKSFETYWRSARSAVVAS